MNLSTNYLGLTLRHPLVPSPSPMSRDLDSIRRLEDAGAPVIVMFSLFEEEVQNTSLLLSHYMDYGSDSVGDVSGYFKEPVDYVPPMDRYLALLSEAKDATNIPIIASLNCSGIGEWVEYAAELEKAGADAIELNIYDLMVDPLFDGLSAELHFVSIVEAVKNEISIPLAVKLHPFFTSLPNVALQLSKVGADALVLFNRFYQPDINIDTFLIEPSLQLSDSHELRLPLRWTAILSGRVPVDLAITTGIHNHIDLIKALMVGANIGMIASELLKNGVTRLEEIVTDLQQWMEEHEYESVEQMQGCMSYRNVDDPSHFIRANYIRTLQSFRFDPTGQSL